MKRLIDIFREQNIRLNESKIDFGRYNGADYLKAKVCKRVKKKNVTLIEMNMYFFLKTGEVQIEIDFSKWSDDKIAIFLANIEDNLPWTGNFEEESADDDAIALFVIKIPDIRNRDELKEQVKKFINLVLETKKIHKRI